MHHSAIAGDGLPPLVRAVKRTLDVAIAALGLLLLWPLYAVIAVAVVIDSRGPIIYRQRRAGTLLGAVTEDGVRHLVFTELVMHKFRTMRADAEAMTGAVLAAENDPRVTRVGRLLRATRLDELPQLWDVLRGAMSVVGPRPERPELIQDLAAAIPLFEERMHGVKPGITGLAQVSLGYLGTIPQGTALAQLAPGLQNPFGLAEATGAIADDMRVKMLFDLAYVASLERIGTYLRMELSIIVKTPLVMMRGVGR
ncbi:MAG TPA: sugar transferase [Kofleriaceae bacterium]|nr:sugar transferase [Kofleriaceae bacterium]